MTTYYSVLLRKIAYCRKTFKLDSRHTWNVQEIKTKLKKRKDWRKKQSYNAGPGPTSQSPLVPRTRLGFALTSAAKSDRNPWISPHLGYNMKVFTKQLRQFSEVVNKMIQRCFCKALRVLLNHDPREAQRAWQSKRTACIYEYAICSKSALSVHEHGPIASTQRNSLAAEWGAAWRPKHEKHDFEKQKACI